MASDFEIGRVMAVDTAQVTIELNRDLKALTRSTYEGAYEIGRINSYVVLPVGARRLVAMVTRVVLAEEAEVTADRTMVTLPSARRLMKATLTGTIDGSVYTQGITIFPVLDNPVHKDVVLRELLVDGSEEPRHILTTARERARTHVGEPDGGRFSKPLPLDVQQNIQEGLCPIIQKLIAIGAGGDVPSVSADSPVLFSKDSFRREHLEKAMQRDQAGGSRARDYCATMLMRVYRLLEDRRFEFLFGPVDGQWPRHEHALATFLRDLLGLAAADTPSPALSGEAAVPAQALPYYDRQRADGTPHKVVIVVLSLLAAEVLENVTALIGRIILEFLQRLGEAGGADARGSLPVVLVLEEAQNYIREKRFGDEDSISRDVFERIAREGRKYGLSLVVASQRPSELSKTVLSQCNSFVVHRLQNPEDLRYFKEIVPGIYGPLLDQLPALAPQTALILGECVRAPALVRIREARPVPRSRDPKFYQHWVADDARKPDVEAICARWEGKHEDQGES